MVGRFSLYGFLKNQQYYDPFIILAFLEKGLSFTTIGFLIGFRGVCNAVLEIPTGAVADSVGRRRSMIFSHLAYIASFAIFAFAKPVWMLFAAMFMFSVGETFRTGTHKAIIFDWLAHEGRSDEKVKVYGITRSWSKLGSAVSVVIASALVFVTQTYSLIFLFSIAPYLANIVNFLSYPAYLDGPRNGGSFRAILSLLLRSVRRAVRIPHMRRLFAESMGFDGAFAVCKTYLQPVVKTAALAAPLLLDWSDRRRTAVLVGIVYVVMNLLASLGSRRANAVAEWAGSPSAGARRLWVFNVACYLALAGSFLLPAGGATVAITAFVLLALLQNFWRPIQVSRFAVTAQPDEMATILSIESQSKALFAAVTAPLLGFIVDRMGPELKFLPVGLLGLIVSTAILATARPRKSVLD